MKTLVTGGTGFVGSHLVRRLIQAGHEVRVLHREQSKLDALEGLEFVSKIGDIIDYPSLESAMIGVDWVFHVAAVADYWRSNQENLLAVNVAGTENVFKAALATGVKRVIFTSSAAAVGFIAERPATESDAFNQVIKHFPYGYSKWKAEEIAQHYLREGLEIVILNPVVIIGPGDLNMISGTFIVQTAHYKALTPVTSGGTSIIDVRDVADAHLAAAEKGSSGERYILSTANYSYRDWFNMIADALGVSRPKIYIPDRLLPLMVGFIGFLKRLGIHLPIDQNQVRLADKMVYFNAAKSHEILGEPKISIEESLKETIQWYRQHGFL